VRFLEFFAANIRNPHTRRAYARAAEEFLTWCADADVPSITDVQPVHVATWIEAATRGRAAPSVKQRLAAIRHLFDWLVTGQVVPVNPAGSVRGPRHVVTSGQTPVLDPAEARALLDSIDVSTHAGLRDRALIGLMVYSFARIGAVAKPGPDRSSSPGGSRGVSNEPCGCGEFLWNERLSRTLPPEAGEFSGDQKGRMAPNQGHLHPGAGSAQRHHRHDR
jgi:hypothetical protein